MEKARQHPTLTSDQMVLAPLYFGGLVAFVFGIVAQFTLGGRSLHIGLLAFVSSKVAISIWSIVRPASVTGKRARPAVKMLIALAWITVGALLTMPLLGKSL